MGRQHRKRDSGDSGEGARRGSIVDEQLAQSILSAVGGDPELRLAPITDYLSTGCTLLDLAIADKLPGGFAVGRIGHVYGGESTGKSLILSEVLGAAQRKGGLAGFCDVEHTFDEERSLLYGLDVDPRKFVYTTPETIEELFDTVIRTFCAAREGSEPPLAPWAIGVDSLSALTSFEEREEQLGAASYQMSRAKVISTAFRKWVGRMSHNAITTIFVDQTRSKVGPVPGETTSAGKALRFYATTRVRLRELEKVRNKYGKVVGVWVAFEVTKNKAGPPFREGTFRMLFDYGIDNTASNLDWLLRNTADVENYPVSRGGSWFSWFGERVQGEEALIKLVEDRGEENLLIGLVEERWHQVYPSGGRKPRSRETERPEHSRGHLDDPGDPGAPGVAGAVEPSDPVEAAQVGSHGGSSDS